MKKSRKTNPRRNPFEDAKAGRIKNLFAIADGDEFSTKDREAYKWLQVALDFGHRKAQKYIETICEASSLRYDDDDYQKAAAHWEIGIAYLRGAIKHPRRISLAQRHLDLAFQNHELSEINEGTGESYSLDQERSYLKQREAQVLQKSLELAQDPFRKAIRQVNQIQRLHRIGSVPTIFIENEIKLLEEEIETIKKLVGLGVVRT